MVKKKDLVIVALATFCLTATLFMIRSTQSNPSIGEYDSWTDLNGDGTVDIYDAITLANAYGTSGDPTRNVTVTNWPPDVSYKLITLTLNCSWTQYVNPELGWSGSAFTSPIDVRGFSRIYLYTTPTGPVDATSGNYSVTHQMTIVWNVGGSNDDYNMANITIQAENGDTFYYNRNMNYFREVRGPSIQVWIWSNSTNLPGWMLYTLNMYLRNE